MFCCWIIRLLPVALFVHCCPALSTARTQIAYSDAKHHWPPLSSVNTPCQNRPGMTLLVSLLLVSAWSSSSTSVWRALSRRNRLEEKWKEMEKRGEKMRWEGCVSQNKGRKRKEEGEMEIKEEEGALWRGLHWVSKSEDRGKEGTKVRKPHQHWDFESDSLPHTQYKLTPYKISKPKLMHVRFVSKIPLEVTISHVSKEYIMRKFPVQQSWLQFLYHENAEVGYSNLSWKARIENIYRIDWWPNSSLRQCKHSRVWWTIIVA